MHFGPQLLTLYANAVDLIPKQLAIGRNVHSVILLGSNLDNLVCMYCTFIMISVMYECTICN